MALSTTLLQLANTEGVRIKLREYSEKQYPKNLQNVHTPFPLVKEMLDKLPSLEGYILTFNMEFVEVLIYDYNVDPKMIYFLSDCEEKVKIIKGKKRYEGVWAIKCDVLNNNIEWRMKFKAIVGNPPYQTKSSVSNTKTQPIWDKFIDVAFEHLEDDGYLCFVHPSAWRNVDGRFKKTQELLKSKQMEYLEIHDTKDGLKTFGATTRYDWYVVKNTPNDGSGTRIKFQDGTEGIVDLSKLEFIPNGMMEDIEKLIAKDGDEKTNILYSCYYHTQNTDRVSRIKDGDYNHPLVLNVRVTNEPSVVLYTNITNPDHHGVSKIILTRLGEAAMIDARGEYGICQDCFAIIDSIDNLENIHKAVKSKKFIELMKMANVGGQAGNVYNYKIMGLFRKDFWKDFV